MSLYDRILTEDQRPLYEGVKVGDYVIARDGRNGYADRVEGGQVYFVYTTNKKSENVVLDVDDVNVTTVEDIDRQKRLRARKKYEKSPNYQRFLRQKKAQQSRQRPSAVAKVKANPKFKARIKAKFQARMKARPNPARP